MTSWWKVLCDQFNMIPCVFVVALVLHLTEANYGVKYLGCFGDNRYQRALNKTYTYWSAATVDWCVNHCAVTGYRYAGLQWYNQCRCGNLGYDKYGEQSKCNYQCPGNQAQICGGSYQNSVYEIVPVTTTPHSSQTTTTKSYTSMSSAGQPRQVYLGCFTPGGVSKTYIEQANLTVGACLDHCNEAGYRYAWLNHGDRCRCGDSGLIANQIGRDDCNLTCSGNSSQLCGSISYYSVYIRVRYAVKHLGCYYDGYPKALNETNTYSVDTANTCMDHCDSQGYRYAGLQYGKLCRCGNDGYDRYGEATGCDITCAGDNSQLCGGFYQNSVYEIVRPTVTATSTSLLTNKVSAQTTTFTGNSGDVSKEDQRTIIYALSVTPAVLVLAVIAVIVTVIIRRRRRTTLTHSNNVNIKQQPPTVHPNTDTAADSPNQYESLNAGEENHDYMKLEKEDNSTQADYHNAEMATLNYYNLPAPENCGSDYCEIIG